MEEVLPEKSSHFLESINLESEDNLREGHYIAHVDVRYLDNIQRLKDKIKSCITCNETLCPVIKERIERHILEHHSNNLRDQEAGSTSQLGKDIGTTTEQRPLSDNYRSKYETKLREEIIVWSQDLPLYLNEEDENAKQNLLNNFTVEVIDLSNNINNSDYAFKINVKTVNLLHSLPPHPDLERNESAVKNYLALNLADTIHNVNEKELNIKKEMASALTDSDDLYEIVEDNPQFNSIGDINFNVAKKSRIDIKGSENTFHDIDKKLNIKETDSGQTKNRNISTVKSGTSDTEIQVQRSVANALPKYGNVFSFFNSQSVEPKKIKEYNFEIKQEISEWIKNTLEKIDQNYVYYKGDTNYLVEIICNYLKPVINYYFSDNCTELALKNEILNIINNILLIDCYKYDSVFKVHIADNLIERIKSTIINKQFQSQIHNNKSNSFYKQIKKIVFDYLQNYRLHLHENILMSDGIVNLLLNDSIPVQFIKDKLIFIFERSSDLPIEDIVELVDTLVKLGRCTRFYNRSKVLTEIKNTQVYSFNNLTEKPSRRNDFNAVFLPQQELKAEIDYTDYKFDSTNNLRQEPRKLQEIKEVINGWLNTIPRKFVTCEENNYRDIIVKRLARDIKKQQEIDKNKAPKTAAEIEKRNMITVYKWLNKTHLFKDLNNANSFVKSLVKSLQNIVSQTSLNDNYTEILTINQGTLNSIEKTIQKHLNKISEKIDSINTEARGSDSNRIKNDTKISTINQETLNSIYKVIQKNQKLNIGLRDSSNIKTQMTIDNVNEYEKESVIDDKVIPLTCNENGKLEKILKKHILKYIDSKCSDESFRELLTREFPDINNQSRNDMSRNKLDVELHYLIAISNYLKDITLSRNYKSIIQLICSLARDFKDGCSCLNDKVDFFLKILPISLELKNEKCKQDITKEMINDLIMNVNQNMLYLRENCQLCHTRMNHKNTCYEIIQEFVCSHAEDLKQNELLLDVCSLHLVKELNSNRKGQKTNIAVFKENTIQYHNASINNDILDIEGLEENIRGKSLRERYKQNLEYTLTITMPNSLTMSNGNSPYFEIYKDRLASIFILENFDCEQSPIKINYERRLLSDIDRYFPYALETVQFTKDQLYNALYSTLFYVSMPSDKSIAEEVEIIKLRCEIDMWFDKLPIREAKEFNDFNERQQIISLLAKKIYGLEKHDPNSEENIHKYIKNIILKLPILPGKEVNLDNLINDLQRRLKLTETLRKHSNKTDNLFDILQIEPILTKKSQYKYLSYETDTQTVLPGCCKVRPVLHKRPLDIILDLVENWCEQIPVPATTQEEKVNIQTIKDQRIMKLMIMISELNSIPEIFNDDTLYDKILDDEIENIIFSSLQSNCDCIRKKGTLKRKIIDAVISVKPLLVNEVIRYKYKQELKNVADDVLEISNAEKRKRTLCHEMRNEIVDNYIIYKYHREDIDNKNNYKILVSNAVFNFFSIPTIRYSNYVDPLIKSNQLICELNKIPPPKVEVLIDEVEEIRMKFEVNKLFKDLSLSDDEERLALKLQIKSTLARRLCDLEKSDHSSAIDLKMKYEITEHLAKMNETVDDEKIKAFIARLKDTENIRKTHPPNLFLSNPYNSNSQDHTLPTFREYKSSALEYTCNSPQSTNIDSLGVLPAKSNQKEFRERSAMKNITKYDSSLDENLHASAINNQQNDLTTKYGNKIFEKDMSIDKEYGKPSDEIMHEYLVRPHNSQQKRSGHYGISSTKQVNPRISKKYSEELPHNSGIVERGKYPNRTLSLIKQAKSLSAENLAQPLTCPFKNIINNGGITLGSSQEGPLFNPCSRPVETRGYSKPIGSEPLSITKEKKHQFEFKNSHKCCYKPRTARKSCAKVCKNCNKINNSNEREPNTPGR
ncbi:uncharacterized protein LOC126971323 [Leptidea sinapis]|uniref:uncharacterized protein LOC126971323 n=1 Tax=Leptidea sinapis TaxID=189913 RepID=UPI0021C2E89E|nr:uncharacterized protein LOC126971323 [Leptidea sinapis]